MQNWPRSCVFKHNWDQLGQRINHEICHNDLAMTWLFDKTNNKNSISNVEKGAYISWMLEVSWSMSTVETKGHVSPPRVKILIQYNSNLLQTFSTYSSKGDFIRNCFNFDPTFFSFSNFGKKILKLCIFSALGSSFVLLSFWPGTHKTRQTLRFWQPIQVPSNLAQDFNFHTS